MMKACMHAHEYTPRPCMLTEALDETDDTSSTPFSWHFHGVNSHTEGQGYNRQRCVKRGREEEIEYWEKV